MASEFDETDFVDGDFRAAQKSSFAASATGGTGRPPTREELDSRVTETQQRLMELKRAQEELEHERAALEEARRRRSEFQTGREEVLQSLTRGVGFLEEAEFNARRDAEQMARTLGELRDALTKVQSIHEETWTQENYNVELTRALTVIDNARMEWNAARLKWALLNGPQADQDAESPAGESASPSLDALGFFRLCKIGLAFTWPLVLAVLAALGVFIFILTGHK